MWLPSPIYEALPTAYVIIGALLLGGAWYVGHAGPATYAYAALGTASVLGGIAIHLRRRQARQSHADES